ncbi:GNAT family N-acetyltransferase [Halosegnis marinus]|uniref:GNAT family N-acetyltransferase n=1 Tax=Halosegnis marinus TaxID=3034023 RepID=A0ABD5ZPW9_9EURY|nr:GNAT family N-acetyltransferase [Halosegnis sp. DT85]
MTVRPATPEDVPAIREVADDAWWDTYPGVLDTDRIRAGLETLYDPEFLREVLDDRDDLLFLVAERDGEVVGFVSARQTFADEVELFTLFVAPDRQRDGIGTELLGAVEESARAADAERLRAGVLAGNAVGRAFFEGHGFERVETVTTEVGGESHPEDVLERSLDDTV